MTIKIEDRSYKSDEVKDILNINYGDYRHIPGYNTFYNMLDMTKAISNYHHRYNQYVEVADNISGEYSGKYLVALLNEIITLEDFVSHKEKEDIEVPFYNNLSFYQSWFTSPAALEDAVSNIEVDHI